MIALDSPDVARLIALGMDATAALDLVRAREDWRQMEREGAPEGWPPGSTHYLLFPVAQDDCPIARLYWAAAERAALHPQAEQLDALWIRRFRTARGLNRPRTWRAAIGPRDMPHPGSASWKPEYEPLLSARSR